MKILIVDDSTAMRAIGRRALAATGAYASAEVVNVFAKLLNSPT